MTGTKNSYWEMTLELKQNEFERKFDTHEIDTGIKHQLMMPGNYARASFNTPHTILLHLM